MHADFISTSTTSIDTHQLAIDILNAGTDGEVLNALKKHGLFNASKCPICVRMMEARSAVIQ